MKTIIGLSLLLAIIGGLMGCTSNANNANLRNTNTNTGYLTNVTPTPMSTASPMMNSNMNGNMKSSSNMKSNMNSKMMNTNGMKNK